MESTHPTVSTHTQETNPLAQNGTNMSHAQLRVESSMTAKLQYAIDTNGRYATTLNTLALGYAAGSGEREADAKEQIKSVFHERMGMSIQDYLTQHREENGLPVDRSNGNSR